MKAITLAGGIFLLPAAVCAGIINADFEHQAGSWGDGEGPPGWTLNLGDDDQHGIVEAVDFAYTGSHVFRFDSLRTGFGDNRLEQCVALDDRDAFALSARVRTEHAHADLRVRLRIDFYTDPECDHDSANADDEQIETNLALDAERFGSGDWVHIASTQRLAADLGEDVTHMRISLRARDRSDDGGPADPPRTIWFDAISLQATEPVLPARQRAALRALFESTGGEHWKRKAGWMGPEGTECQWRGVHCNDDGDGVAGLDLAGNNLVGELPDAFWELDTLDPGRLDLCWNDLEIPADSGLEALQLGGDPTLCQQPSLVRFDAQRSGALFQPEARGGEGFTLHMLGRGSAVLYWLTYDDHGNPLWLFGTGRALDRVMRIDEVFHARAGDGDTTNENVGHATLVFRDCNAAELRFEINGENFGAAGRRALEYLAIDHDPCGAAAEPSLAATFDGTWFDPAQSGEGFGMVPNLHGQIFLTWMTHGANGHHWLFGVGDPADDRFIFDQLYSVEGGVFDGDMSDMPPLNIPVGAGELDWPGGQPRFHFFPTGSMAEREFELHRITAGPDLLASTGHVLHLEMSPADVEELYRRDVNSDERLPGEVDYGGVAGQASPVALRFRGRSSRAFPKKSFNIRHELEQPLLFWSDRMNLNAMYTDPSMMREALAFELFRALGQPASRTRHFDFWINDHYEGLHLHIDRVDEHLLAANGLNPGGTLVRDEFRDLVNIDPEVDRPSAFGFDINAIEPDRRADFLAARFNFRNDPEWERLVELVAWVHDTPAGDAFEQGFVERVDVDNFIDWLVLHWLTGDRDSFADDYWLYLDHNEPDARWMFIPWDKDLTFGSYSTTDAVANDFFGYERPLQNEWGNGLIERFLQTPALRAQAHARLGLLMTEHFPESHFAKQVAELSELIEDSVSIAPGPGAFKIHDQQHHGALGRFSDHTEVILDYVALRYRYIDRRLNPVSGPAYEANAEIQAGTDEPVFLTDATGFTLMSLTPAGRWPADAVIEARVEPDDNIHGIDRQWTLDSNAELGDVEVTLYYRNAPESTSEDNWWTEAENEPVGRQDEMRIHATRRSPDRQVLETRVNPYSNKATTRIDIGPGSEHFILTLLD